MSNTLWEQTRALHEDIERLERVIVKDFKQDVKTHKEKLMQSHRVRQRLDQIQDSAKKLITLYNDEDGARKEELQQLGQDVWGTFYDRLKEVREYHRKFPTLDITEKEDDGPLLKEEPHVEFTGEEQLGRFLDLHDQYNTFTNAKFGRKLDYYQYMDCFADFGAIPKTKKYTKQYREYLTSLVAYLESFYRRTQPLAQMHKQLGRLEAELEERWGPGQVQGWEDRGRGQLPPAELPIDLEVFESPEELETIGADRLKEALQQLGLKCGGTPRQRAERLFLLRSQPLQQLERKHFAAGVTVAMSEQELEKQEQVAKGVALLEARATKLAELLANVISDTKARLEKKQAQTYEEMLADQVEADAEMMADDDEDDEDEFIYNPLKLPLGWDGKPIPYWLYKLHGLNQEFKCEICGNYSYWGRRAYEKHFQEFRHQQGMRAMGIPMSKAFFEVTKIDDALALHKALAARNLGGFNPETDEELEDAAGNVYNKKLYNDLKKQGIL